MIRPFKNRAINPSLRVRVHRNLHNGMYSVVQHGLVVAHASHIVLSVCEFIVNESGRQRVIRDKRKNVHAFVVGYLACNQNVESLPTRVSYNPYKGASFVTPENDSVSKAFVVCIDTVTGVTAVDLA
jgi:hypothetical protein